MSKISFFALTNTGIHFFLLLTVLKTQNKLKKSIYEKRNWFVCLFLHKFQEFFIHKLFLIIPKSVKLQVSPLIPLSCRKTYEKTYPLMKIENFSEV